MGRKKELNPMEAYRRKQKKAQIAKNKKKRAEAKEKALNKRKPDWIMNEIQKLNRRERQEHGKNEEKYKNQRSKLMNAYDKAVRIQKVREKTQQKNTNNDTSNDNEHSPTPPPIEGQLEDENKNEDDDLKVSNPTTLTTSTPSAPLIPNINNAMTNPISNPISNPMTNPLINPAANMYSHLYTNPLLMNPYQMAASMYSDTLGSKANNPRRPRPISNRDTYDPLNPANPKYNFLHDKDKDHRLNMNPQHKFRQFVNNPCPSNMNPPAIKPQPPSTLKMIQSNKNQNEDITKMSKPKREIEVIMDPKLRAFMPSSMRFKRKFDKPKQVRPTKKRKLDIAPDVDGKKSNNSSVSKSTENRNVNTNNSLDNGNADAAYDKFMTEISGLL